MKWRSLIVAALRSVARNKLRNHLRTRERAKRRLARIPTPSNADLLTLLIMYGDQQQLRDAMNQLVTTTGTTTSTGMFVSENAAFGTGFSIPSTALRPVLGGKVEEKVTIVIIQDKVSVGD